MFNFLRFKKKADNYKPTQLGGVEATIEKAKAEGTSIPGEVVEQHFAAKRAVSVASASYVPEKPKKKTAYPSTKKAPAKAETVGYVTPSRADDGYYSPSISAVYIPDTTDYTPPYTEPAPTYSGGGGDFGGGGSSGSWDSSPSYDSGSSSSSYDSGSSYSDSSSSSSYSD